MKAKVVYVGSVLVRDAKALSKLMEAIGMAEIVPDAYGTMAAISINEIDEKELEYRRLSPSERLDYNDWQAYAAGEKRDEIERAWLNLNYRDQQLVGPTEYRTTYVRRLLKAGDRDAVERMVASHGTAYARKMPEPMQVEIDAFLAGKTLDLSAVKAVANGADRPEQDQ